MNPGGQVHDINSLRNQGYNFESALSPNICLEIVRDLNSPKGKGRRERRKARNFTNENFSGAELFAKRRKRSEKWVVGETNGLRQETINDIAAAPVPLLSPLPPLPPANLPPPSYLPETAQRAQNKQKLDEIQVGNFQFPRNFGLNVPFCL